jgi:phosphohistidine phosphatase
LIATTLKDKKLNRNTLKLIFIIRHAKSSWSNPGLIDNQRPLNSRGLRDAPLMAALLKSNYSQIDRFYSSHAVRAFETAKFIAQAYGALKSDIHIEYDLYHASENDFTYLIQSQSDELESIALFSHNPGITYYINRYSDVYIDNVPTSGIVVLRSTSDKWSNVNTSNTKMIDFFYPKKDLSIYK